MGKLADAVMAVAVAHVPLVAEPAQTVGDAVLHTKPDSTVQVAEQPSPGVTFASSHASPV
jgi:hypothetical protein